jgi:hypothetical protein
VRDDGTDSAAGPPDAYRRWRDSSPRPDHRCLTNGQSSISWTTGQ